MHRYDNRYNGIFKEGNYKETFTREVEVLLSLTMKLPERMKMINDLLVAYAEQTGEVPDGKQINRLTDCILREDLQYNHPDKVANTDYPFLSRGQQRLRKRREISTDTSRMSSDSKHKLNGRKKKTSYNKEG